MTENERFGLVFANTGSINSEIRKTDSAWKYLTNYCYTTLFQWNRNPNRLDITYILSILGLATGTLSDKSILAGMFPLRGQRATTNVIFLDTEA
jgi:hypothetical protein